MNALKKWIVMGVVVCLVVLNLLVRPTAVYACSCAMPESPEKELERATAVFAGRVTDIDERGGLVISSADPVKITFQVSEVWKGPVQVTLEARTARSSASCGYSFTMGQEYLVYANGSETDLEVWLCSRTAPLATAVTDLTVLGTGVIPTSDSSGSVTPNLWLAAVFFILLGLLLIVTGLFMPQLNRWLRVGERSQLFTVPHFRQAARQTEFIGRAVQVLLGLGLILQGIGRFYPHALLNVVSLLFLGLAGIGILFILAITVCNWRA